jgi:hypothetical protein
MLEVRERLQGSFFALLDVWFLTRPLVREKNPLFVPFPNGLYFLMTRISYFSLQRSAMHIRKSLTNNQAVVLGEVVCWHLQVQRCWAFSDSS